MRCASVEKLLPLYVEGDLSERETGAIRSHLTSCNGCRKVSEEFNASQRRLRSLTAPVFDDEFYRSMRGAVLAEIKAAPDARPALFNSFRQLLSPGPALAASLALLMVLSVAAGLIYKRLYVTEAGRMAALENSVREIKPGEYGEVLQAPSSDNSTGRAGEEKPYGRRGRASGLASRQKIIGADDRLALSGNSVAPDGVAVSASPARATSADEGAASGASSTTEAVARMEIQTGDPNIRIIWLGRKSSE